MDTQNMQSRAKPKAGHVKPEFKAPVAKKLAELNLAPLLGKPEQFDNAVKKLTERIVVSNAFSKTAIRLFVVLARMINRQRGYCYPGVKALADELDLSVQAIRKGRRELEDAGVIRVLQNASHLDTNIYFLNFCGLDLSASTASDGSGSAPPETKSPGGHFKGVFGETKLSGGITEEDELIEFARELDRIHG